MRIATRTARPQSKNIPERTVSARRSKKAGQARRLLPGWAHAASAGARSCQEANDVSCGLRSLARPVPATGIAISARAPA